MRYTLDDFVIANGSEFSVNRNYRNNAEELINDMMEHFAISVNELELSFDEYSITARGVNDHLYYFKVFTPAAYLNSKLIDLFWNQIEEAGEKNITAIWSIDSDGLYAGGFDIDIDSATYCSTELILSDKNGNFVSIDFEKIEKCEVNYDGYDMHYKFNYKSGVKATVSFLY